MAKKTAKKPKSLERQADSKPAESGATPDSGAKLTPKQQAFIKHYLIEKNATQAAKLAGYSEDTATEMGYENLRKPHIKAAIDVAFKDQNTRLDLTADRILLELFRLSTFDMSEAYDKNTGKLLALHEMPEDVRRAIGGIDTQEMNFGFDENDEQKIGTIKKVKFLDKNAALTTLARHFKLLTDKIEIDDKSGLAARLARARKKKE